MRTKWNLEKHLTANFGHFRFVLLLAFNKSEYEKLCGTLHGLPSTAPGLHLELPLTYLVTETTRSVNQRHTSIDEP